MKYLLMIYADESVDAKKSKEESDRIMGAYYGYTNELESSGALKSGEALHPTAMATTVRVRNGSTMTTDGPFAETKEQLAGYYLIDCQNLDQAIQWASKIPHASEGGIEIRPVVDFSAAATA